MASQTPSNNQVASEQLWQSFLETCKKINAARFTEDAPESQTRNKELNFFRSFGNQGAEDVYNGAVAWDAGLATKHMKRSNEDMAIVKALFDQAVAMGRSEVMDSMGMGGTGHMMNASAAGVANIGKFVRPPKRDIDGRHGDMSYMVLTGGEASLARGRKTAVDSGASGQGPNVQAGGANHDQDGGLVQDPVVHAENPDTMPRPTQFALSEVPVGARLVAWPKHASTYYVLLCPLCHRYFDSAHGIFAHFAQSDTQHLGLFGGNKSFKTAVAVGGIPLVPEEGEQEVDVAAIKAHNDRLISDTMGN